MMIYVDDFIIAAPTNIEIQTVVSMLQKYYDIKDLGEPKQYLNCALVRDYEKRTISLSQSAYMQKILRRETAIEEDSEALLDNDSFDHYQSVVGMLNWLAVKTRPDIRFAVTRLQHRLAKPTLYDIQALHHVIKYLRQYPDLGIVLAKSDELQFSAYSDASHADWQDSKSTEGVIWFFAGSPVMWFTKKQTITANSTTVAEWCALDQPSRDAMWLNKVADSLQLPRPDATVIYTDSINSQLLLSKKGGQIRQSLAFIEIFLRQRCCCTRSYQHTQGGIQA
ncbi:uncharacterized protein N7500_008999 [Penicillium coprophilum]|uniref:uncharacterized protein n=1 Tax=Penicillium coprophilum TaxID=36646 RepID=UPI002381EB7E|nr:uncharacterized protein N7500_008999 [Penicillium coprophilum]KAJ5159348.1 hypothetical protein N7500_008999 [Penicillium coprophilum]